MGKVLIVDDDYDLLEVLNTILSDVGFQALTICRPEEILENIFIFCPSSDYAGC